MYNLNNLVKKKKTRTVKHQFKLLWFISKTTSHERTYRHFLKGKVIIY